MLSKIKIVNTSHGHMVLNQGVPQNITPDWFTESFWRAQNAIVGSSKGRYTTWFVASAGTHWVLRHYWRGGLIEKLSKDAYVYLGQARTRAMGEFRLLNTLYNEGFTVPKPIAINVERHGMYYRADIIIERVAGAEDLVAKLTHSPMTELQWQQLGKTIANFHQRGVYHADLNAKNILITHQHFYLIDFDRGVLKTPQLRWQQANLSRLQRSFNKEKARLTALAFTEQNWQSLLLGYTQTMHTYTQDH